MRGKDSGKDGIRRSGIREMWNDGSHSGTLHFLKIFFWVIPGYTLRVLKKNTLHLLVSLRHERDLSPGQQHEKKASCKFLSPAQMPLSTWTLVRDSDSLFHTHSRRQTTTPKKTLSPGN